MCVMAAKGPSSNCKNHHIDYYLNPAEFNYRWQKCVCMQICKSGIVNR